MTYEERRGQEELLPSSLHHDHPGAAAPGAHSVFLALIGGEMPPRGPQGSLGSSPAFPDPFRATPTGTPRADPGPCGTPQPGSESTSFQCVYVKDSVEAELDRGP